ncbi:unnamed protein product [Adineta steineri]|uniref:3-oxo-5-alpha-steroid 4-dehydrogenase C-terminal domain-containing protein n=1 Tax=Adineta steineri TaxID=433720 RepID=A0A813V4J0_9BILA|nr:unnamed protein product [Adineta steineri]CAF0843284.1 unnamed protein product [Adineta steineri]CAF3604379.1 unnamed protein product [Adineta steineri]CAF3610575.1 unnamed protein product [Adineta steineri]
MLEYILNDHIFVSYTCPYLWFIGAAVVLLFEVILDIKAPYGRYNTTNGGIPVRLAWFIQELPSFVVPCYILYNNWSSISITKLIIISFFLIHYFQRVFIYPMLIRGGKHSSYLTTILAFIFCSLNAYSIAEELIVYHIYPNNYLFSLRFLIGTILFFTGFILNLQSDAILRNLRKDNSQRDYQIPRGGLFEYVSGANFLAESIEWTGYAICAGTLPAIAFSVFTWANTAFGRGIHHHKFYLEKFRDEYPKNRKAIIPFIL